MFAGMVGWILNDSIKMPHLNHIFVSVLRLLEQLKSNVIFVGAKLNGALSDPRGILLVSSSSILLSSSHHNTP
ncbi:hypothetical protein CCHR01_12298 [Colletotrichum chrysophilum]|uniref:Uncharacterized protein n=1 Tax=Colletotrichum chrysophilum TaxID=1836956 RepID=A0AAD9AC77_9PEZI|nr:hypothetical protein CCHR01_12298 [Colletotrichum chrysophilum]